MQASDILERWNILYNAVKLGDCDHRVPGLDALPLGELMDREAKWYNWALDQRQLLALETGQVQVLLNPLENIFFYHIITYN
jgi:hypothetical protein